MGNKSKHSCGCKGSGSHGFQWSWNIQDERLIYCPSKKYCKTGPVINHKPENMSADEKSKATINTKKISKIWWKERNSNSSSFTGPEMTQQTKTPLSSSQVSTLGYCTVPVMLTSPHPPQLLLFVFNFHINQTSATRLALTFESHLFCLVLCPIGIFHVWNVLWTSYILTLFLILISTWYIHYMWITVAFFQHRHVSCCQTLPGVMNVFTLSQ